jgi:hypothetical protein
MGRRRDSTSGGKRRDERPALAMPLHPATVASREAVTRTGDPRDPALDPLRDALLLTIYWRSSSGASGPQRVFADVPQEARIAQICAAALDRPRFRIVRDSHCMRPASDRSPPSLSPAHRTTGDGVSTLKSLQISERSLIDSWQLDAAPVRIFSRGLNRVVTQIQDGTVAIPMNGNKSPIAIMRNRTEWSFN